MNSGKKMVYDHEDMYDKQKEKLHLPPLTTNQFESIPQTTTGVAVSLFRAKH
jgi:hypothetical protein